ncbi:S8 family serine peptidase, partial [Arthrobacter sp. M4]|uniref:S8 family serine peptidase n=1 Tax=Arthrobacter sp. M4 TaxID=218160 RepID=UPI001CDD624B
MNRDYYQRGQRKSLEEIENVISVKAPASPAARRELGAELRAADVGMSEETFEAFQNANWVFVQPTSDTSRRLEARELGDLAESAGKVVKKDNGRFGIVSTRLNVQLEEDIPEDQAEGVLADLGLQLVGPLTFARNLYEVETTAHADALEASLALHDDSRVKMAEPTFEEHIPGRFTPTDPRYGDQWQWSNTGQAGGTAGADVSAEEAWDRTRGAGIRVAVIDNGFLATHEDLQAGVVGTSGFFVSATPRATFTQGTAGMPGSNHGTFCAGMVGARQGNGVGVSGAAPDSDLMLVACLGDQVGTQTTLARAVAYAADPSREIAGADPATGADILVSSLGPNGAAWDLTSTLQLALEFAAASGRSGRGMAIFWAASNGNNVDVMQDEVVSHADVIAVVRSTNMDLEDNAARGPEVELIAPGVNVVSTTGSGGYGTSTGTSFAAPAAAGCAALALSVNPGLTRDELRTIMRETADKIGGVTYDVAGHNDDYGFGRVNAAAAVDAAETAGATAVKGKDIALVRQTPGWATIPVAFSRGDGNWDIT